MKIFLIAFSSFAGLLIFTVAVFVLTIVLTKASDKLAETDNDEQD